MIIRAEFTDFGKILNSLFFFLKFDWKEKNYFADPLARGRKLSGVKGLQFEIYCSI